jgi:membrane-bound inhibitor of C-type lysozyme
MKFALLLSFCALVCSGCTDKNLNVILTSRAVYRTPESVTIRADYYELSDRSLSFVKIRLPDRPEITLPRAFSASGVRYTDDFQYVWWTKGDQAFCEIREPDGSWSMLYQDCREVSD